jgi:hypothetical protein
MATWAEHGMPVHSVHRAAHPHPIPWSLFNEEWAQNNHRQSLKELASRGGLSMCEALAIIERRPWTEMPMGKSFDRLMELEGRPERFKDGVIR